MAILLNLVKRNFTKLHLSRDADFSIENYYAKQERVSRTGIVIFTGVCHIFSYQLALVSASWLRCACGSE